MKDVVIVYSGKNLSYFQNQGGIGYWAVQSSRIRQAKYILVIRNLNEAWAVRDGVAQGQAFFLGKISGCSDKTPHKGRKLILISEYALLSQDDALFLNAWEKLTGGQRYPVAYLSQQEVLDKLAFNVASPELQWYSFEVANSPEIAVQEIQQETVKSLADVIAEAKEKIANAAGVDSGKISIQIHY